MARAVKYVCETSRSPVIHMHNNSNKYKQGYGGSQKWRRGWAKKVGECESSSNFPTDRALQIADRKYRCSQKFNFPLISSEIGYFQPQLSFMKETFLIGQNFGGHSRPSHHRGGNAGECHFSSVFPKEGRLTILLIAMYTETV